jgi:hypothetical protein
VTDHAHSPELLAAAAEAMAQISRELDEAAAICVEAGFELPHRIEQILDDPVGLLRWNLSFVAAARAWIAGDPNWLTIGVGPRLAVEFMDAGVGVQLAAHGLQRLPLAGAIALHGCSVVYGSWRTELHRWKRGDYVVENVQAAFATTVADTAETSKAAAVSEHMRSLQVESVIARTPWRPIARTALRAEMRRRKNLTHDKAAEWLFTDAPDEIKAALRANGVPGVTQVSSWIGTERKNWVGPEALEGLPPKGVAS